MGTASCGSGSDAIVTRRCAAASTIDPYRANTRHADSATARTAVRPSLAAKTFCPYQGAAMYVKHVSTINEVTNQNGSAGCVHCASGATAS